MSLVDLSGPDYNHTGTELKVKVRIEGHPKLAEDGVVIDMKGDLNLYSTPMVKTILNNLVDIAGKRKIYLNLEGLDYIDSSGLGAFLSLQSKLMKMNGYVRVCAPSRQVLAVLELTKLKTMLRVAPTLDMAF